MEHVDNPIEIVKLAKDWLEEDGVMLLGVPNALSIHRLATVKIGMLKYQMRLTVEIIHLRLKRIINGHFFRRY